MSRTTIDKIKNWGNVTEAKIQKVVEALGITREEFDGVGTTPIPVAGFLLACSRHNPLGLVRQFKTPLKNHASPVFMAGVRDALRAPHADIVVVWVVGHDLEPEYIHHDCLIVARVTGGTYRHRDTVIADTDKGLVFGRYKEAAGKMPALVYPMGVVGAPIRVTKHGKNRIWGRVVGFTRIAPPPRNKPNQ